MKIVIIGGGIAGLTAAAHLKAGSKVYGKDLDILLLEKNNRIGGKILTERQGEFLIEGGPDCFLPEKVWAINLARRLGIESELLPTNDEFKGTFIYSNRMLHPLPEGVMLMVPTAFRPMAKSRLLSLSGKMRMGMDVFIPRRKTSDDESLASFVTRRLGHECLEKIAEPLVAGIHTSNPDNMSVLSTFPRFLSMEKKHRSLILGMLAARRNRPLSSLITKKRTDIPRKTFFMSYKDGMHTLSQACADFFGKEKIRLGTAVKDVRPANVGYTITTESGELFKADHIIFATPSYETARTLKNVDENLVAQINRIEWSSSATISLAFRRDEIQVPLPGFGFIVPRIEGRRINAATFISIKWSCRAPEDHILIRVYIGGGHHEELVTDLDDVSLESIVLQELDSILGLKANPHLVKIYRWIQGMPKYTVGHSGRIAVLDRTLETTPGLHLIGCSYKGIGIGDCIHQAQITAEKILKLK
ncbi:MAG: protoporphyrinogen oxidase [Nitrospirota bacterium]